MKKLTLEIRPGKGFGELDFTASDQQVLDYLGDPDTTEVVDDEEDSMSTILWDYIDKGFSLFFEGDNTARFAACETDNPETSLFGQKIFELTEDEIIDLMKENNYKNIDTDNEIWGERRVSFDDALIDFYFKNDRLISVNWGVVINEKGEVEWYK
ncbi:MAG: hypothetical protein K9H84_03885 [Bacteroidales bacterium]|nr:hypothetical protein [Bacteroidales bacterium]